MSITTSLVKDFMTPNPVAILETELVEAAVKLMEERQISGLPVVDSQNHVTGLLSEEDLLVRESPLKPPLYMTLLGSIFYLESPDQFHQHLKKSLGMLVQDVMTGKPATIAPDAPLSDAAHLMIEKHINRLPVVDADQTLVGIITRHDLVSALKPGVFTTPEG
ncbi:MAG TPA: CBS domain-containing protein [Stenomitos sp.]